MLYLYKAREDGKQKFNRNQYKHKQKQLKHHYFRGKGLLEVMRYAGNR